MTGNPTTPATSTPMLDPRIARRVAFDFHPTDAPAGGVWVQRTPNAVLEYLHPDCAGWDAQGPSLPLRESAWTLIRRLEPNGLRLFVDREGKPAVADNSGVLPDRTDDGVLWLDVEILRAEGLTGTMGSGYFTVPVKRLDGMECATAVGLIGALELRRLFGASIYIETAGVKVELTPVKG